MNQYIFLRRLRGPVILLIFGITAILDQYTSIHYGSSWPLYLIALGILKLAENAVLAHNPPTQPSQYPGYPPQGGPGGPGYGPGYGNPPGQGPGYPASSWSTPSNPASSPSSTAIVPSQGEERR
jgi:hypothetical protein